MITVECVAFLCAVHVFVGVLRQMWFEAGRVKREEAEGPTVDVLVFFSSVLSDCLTVRLCESCTGYPYRC